MKIEGLMNDEMILAELGARIARRRLDLEYTQAEVAELAGVGKRTVERIEAGATTQLVTLIRIFRALEMIDRLDGLAPEVRIRPMDLIKLRGKQRQRAPRKKRAMTVREEPWKWDEE